MIEAFWLMVCAHALCDYSLQSDFIAKGKNRHTPIPNMPWYYVMAAHSLVHGMAVTLITNNIWLGMAETVVHFGIDTMKCEDLIDIHADQGLHILYKGVWSCFS